MPEVLDWQRTNQQDVARRAAQALSEGRLVAFPTETAYHITANGLAPAAVEALARQVGEARPLMLAVRTAAEALDWAPGMSQLARRLARRCWPGPVALLLTQGVEKGLASRLPEGVRHRVCPEGALHVRAPAHDALLYTLARFPGPVLAAVPGEPAATSAEAVVRAVGEGVALVIDDGPSSCGQPATVVRVNGEGWGVVQPGVVDEETLAQLVPCTIVFVCTGNTCRSPLAEALCKKLLAERLGCAVGELPWRGYLVLSAGLSATPGDVAAAEAVEVAHELGADLSEHASRRLTHELLMQADHLITMTRGHQRALAPYCTGGVAQPRLLAGADGDVADPIGGDQEVYRACARQIAHCLETLLGELEGIDVSRSQPGEAGT
ncbi:MAG: Sua5/YciO/YrdC/YwlC family protein [Gemmataceae bacterium]|nr:Sua5/YciO/YrdC/YwlC family protein [Gemmataceae bacterium]